jgi:hypothetical protein
MALGSGSPTWRTQPQRDSSSILQTLAILATSKDSRLGALPLSRLQSLNADRNTLAHGHVDQNPFDGAYTLALKEKDRDYPVARVVKLAEQLAQIAERLRHTEEIYAFVDLTAGGAT